MAGYEYQVLAKGYTDADPRQFVIRTTEPARVGATFVADGIAWLVGLVDAEVLWCALVLRQANRSDRNSGCVTADAVAAAERKQPRHQPVRRASF
jgi:hypothetical protein